MKRISNIVVRISNYATSCLEEILDSYSEANFKLASTQMAYDKNGSMVMYLFFTKEWNDGQ